MDQLPRGDLTGEDYARGRDNQAALASIPDTARGRLGAHAVTFEQEGPSLPFEIRYVKHDSGG